MDRSGAASDEARLLALIHEQFGALRRPFSPDARINGPGGLDDDEAEYLIVDAFRLVGLPDKELSRFPYARFFAPDGQGGIPLSALLARAVAFAFDPFGISRPLARRDPLRVGRLLSWLGKRLGRPREDMPAELEQVPLTAQGFIALILDIKKEVGASSPFIAKKN